MNTYLTKVTQETETRTKERTKAHGEVFTPVHVIVDMLDSLEKSNPTCFTDKTKTYLDNSCGNGNILVEVLKRKITNGIDPTIALSTIYGVELQSDNVNECKERLLEIAGNTADNKRIVNINIVCHDALTWDYENWKPESDNWKGLDPKVDMITNLNRAIYKLEKQQKILRANGIMVKSKHTRTKWKLNNGKLTKRQHKNVKKIQIYNTQLEVYQTILDYNNKIYELSHKSNTGNHN